MIYVGDQLVGRWIDGLDWFRVEAIGTDYVVARDDSGRPHFIEVQSPDVLWECCARNLESPRVREYLADNEGVR